MRYGGAVADQLEREYVAVQAGKTKERQDYISQNPSVVARTGSLALLKFASQSPELVAQKLGLELPINATYLGAGSEHTVLQVDDFVIKVHRASAWLSESDRRSMAEQQVRHHRALRSYLGGIVVDQISNTAPHPLKLGRGAVVSRQQPVEFEDLGLFSGYSPRVNQEALELARRQYTGVEDSLKNIVIAGRKLYDNTGLLVDTSGQNNVVMVGGELKMLDGLPIHNPTKSDIRRIMGQLDSLEANL